MERSRVEAGTSDARAPAAPAAAALPAALTPATALALQRTIGNANVVRLARAPAAGVARAPKAAIRPLSSDWDDVVTYTDAAQNYRLGAMWLKEDIEGLDPESAIAKRAAELMEDARASAAWHIKGGEKPIDVLFVEGVREGLDDIRQMRRDIQWEKDAPRRDAIAKAATEAKRLVEEYRKLEPKLLDAARAAFRAEGDDSLAGLAEFLDKYGTNLDIGLGIFEMSRDVSETLMKAKGLEIPAIGKYAQGLTKLNKGMSAINLALSMRGEAGKTEIDKGINGIGFAAGAFSSLGTLFGVSAHIGLWSNLYLVPLTKACLDGVAKLAGHMHEENKTWVEAFGAPGNYAVEPGGKPMWDYMVSVMKAKSSKSVAEPSDAVAAYFMEQRAKFNVGVNAKSSASEIPFTGVWGFRALDKAKFTSWIWSNRHAVWAMLYGSMKTGKS